MELIAGKVYIMKTARDLYDQNSNTYCTIVEAGEVVLLIKVTPSKLIKQINKEAYKVYTVLTEYGIVGCFESFHDADKLFLLPQ